MYIYNLGTCYIQVLETGMGAFDPLQTSSDSNAKEPYPMNKDYASSSITAQRYG